MRFICVNENDIPLCVRAQCAHIHTVVGQWAMIEAISECAQPYANGSTFFFRLVRWCDRRHKGDKINIIRSSQSKNIIFLVHVMTGNKYTFGDKLSLENETQFLFAGFVLWIEWTFLKIHVFLLIILDANQIESVAAVKTQRIESHINVNPGGCRLHFDALIFQSAFLPFFSLLSAVKRACLISLILMRYLRHTSHCIHTYVDVNGRARVPTHKRCTLCGERIHS